MKRAREMTIEGKITFLVLNTMQEGEKDLLLTNEQSPARHTFSPIRKFVNIAPIQKHSSRIILFTREFTRFESYFFLPSSLDTMQQISSIYHPKLGTQKSSVNSTHQTFHLKNRCGMKRNSDRIIYTYWD
jgi:hypothetical protein